MGLITITIENGQWMAESFYYTGENEKKRQSADDRLYEVFALGSNSDEGGFLICQED